MNSEIINQSHQTFESIKKTDDNGNEYWLARELSVLLEYTQWRNFEDVIEKARIACKLSEKSIKNHFADVSKMVDIGSGAKRELNDVKLSRYACYLIVQNGDSSKSVIANGQTYFAIQTRRQELQAQNFTALSEDEKRLMLSNELSEHNKSLVAVAKQSGVETSLDYAIFQDHGYKGLYGGLGAKDIQTKKGLKKSHKILDYMGSTELAANLFRATQTEEKLRRDNVHGKTQANKTHYDVGQKVRNTIKEIGGTMPENLPTPEKSISQLSRQKANVIKGDK
ncbi:MAG: DNA damage-inducible protein D [Pseudomonadota bacterium]